jgi:hypothetical protein
MYYSIIGFVVVLAWVMAALIQYKFVSVDAEFFYSQIPFWLSSFYNSFLNAKLFTFICFVFGLRIYIDVETEVKSNSFLIKIGLLIVLLLGFSWYSSLFLVAIFIALFGILVNYLYKIKPSAIAHLFLGLMLLLVFLASFVPNLNLHLPFFIELYFLPAVNLLSGNMGQHFIISTALLQLVYGFIIIVLGFWAGSTRWLVEYHFHYESLKRLFKYSLILVVVWLVLNYFNVYLLITKWKIGEVFYLFDALTINVVVVFMYLFLLIYFENFRWGKYFLKLLEHLGKLWFVNVIVLFAVGYLLSRQAFQLSFWVYVFGFFILFLIVVVLNVRFSNIYMNRFWLPLNKFIS